MDLAGTETLKKVVVLNPKGGSGKTTLAFGIAGYLASTGRKVALLDMDRQGSSRRWLQNRSDKLPAILGLSPPAGTAGKIHVPSDIDVIVIDAPAAMAAEDLADYTCGMHAILVPVLPSDIDIHAASRLVSDLLLKAQISRRNGRLGIVANRIKERTIAYRRLIRFLESLSIGLIGVLRDSQNYTHAAAEGRCLHEMTASQVSKDMDQWGAITAWLEDRLARPLTPRDWLRPPTDSRPGQWRKGMVPALAAAIGTLAIAAWFFAATNETAFDAADEPGVDRIASNATPVHPIVRNGQPSPTAIEVPAQEAQARQVLESTAPESAPPVEDPGARWQLAGVVQNGGARVLLLNDLSNDTTVSLNVDNQVDGWSVAHSGRDYAVLRQGTNEVRLALYEETTE